MPILVVGVDQTLGLAWPDSGAARPDVGWARPEVGGCDHILYKFRPICLGLDHCGAPFDRLGATKLGLASAKCGLSSTSLGSV